MTMISQILNARSQRVRRRQQGTHGAELPVSASARYARRFRRGLAVVLLAVGTVSFIEVVWLPGKLVRRIMNPAAYSSLTTIDEDEDLRMPPWLMSDEQRNRLRENKAARLQQILQSTYKKTSDSSISLRNSYADLDKYTRLKLGLSLQQRPTTLPTPLSELVVHEATGKLAWSQLAALSDQYQSADSNVRESIEAIGGRFASGAFLIEDDKEMRSTIRNLNDLSSQIVQARSFVDHLSVLLRERAALARQNRMDITKQGAWQ